MKRNVHTLKINFDILGAKVYHTINDGSERVEAGHVSGKILNSYIVLLSHQLNGNSGWILWSMSAQPLKGQCRIS